MFGLLAYWIVGFGIGRLWALVPGMRALGPGACFLLGSAGALIAYPLLHLVVGLPLMDAAWAIAIAAGAGLIVSVPELGRVTWEDAPHPIIILPGLAFAVVLWQGTVDYLPYTDDEFTNWLDIPRRIFLEDGYRAIRHDVPLSGYTPGWRLWLTLPWFLADRFAPGDAATAPLLLHVGVLGVIFDACRRAVPGMPVGPRLIAAWGVVLLLGAAEAMGPLWVYTILIEQPQIYLAVGALLTLFGADDADTNRRLFWLIATGVFCAASYFLKSAGMLVAGGCILAVLAGFLWQQGDSRARRLLALAFVAVPPVALYLLWQSGVENNNCLASPVRTVFMQPLPDYAREGWTDLLVRFAAGVSRYIGTYKWPLTLVGAAGWALLAWRRSWSPVIAMGAFIGVYFATLYVFHLTCFGAYYFEKLASIERFTRVPLQMFQTLGLAALALEALRLVDRRGAALARSKMVLGAGMVLVLALGGWQVLGLTRTAHDITDRRHQNTDKMIAEMYALSRAVDRLSDGRPIRVLLIEDRAPVLTEKYARFFAHRGGRGAPKVAYTVDVIKLPAGALKLAHALTTADVAWPTLASSTDREIVDSAAGTICLAPTPNRFLSKENGRFRCTEKPRADTPWSVATGH